ncbi:uncharacterized protein LOC120258692 [Dioscorea cayenensis subsp. rotundata]|uniref:Uncharacterized protein LOC120258692 n=1 Tax=Dioscorea cayennensis subsp. rotundata TaxID=55577 RepID=A0AB40B4J9_DIOCR|nr:uncharacterized protein LOC120258692 [Dioscorea cayenensis subsp. rotundata]
MSRKMKDPGSFTIPCNISELVNGKAIVDLGVSINIMPFTMFRKLGLSDLKPTRMILQLADRLISHPRGIIKDILVKVDKFIFLVDVVILHIDEDVDVPLILGLPFLATSQVLFDISNGRMVLGVGDEKVVFALSDAMKHSLAFDDTCYFMDMTESIFDDFVKDMLHKEPLKELFDDPQDKETPLLLTTHKVEE